MIQDKLYPTLTSQEEETDTPEEGMGGGEEMTPETPETPAEGEGEGEEVEEETPEM